MRARYIKTVFYNPESEYRVAVMATNQGDEVPLAARDNSVTDLKRVHFTATGYHLPDTGAVEVELAGEWKSGKYGLQFAVDTCTEIRPKTIKEILGYLSSGLIAGVGPMTANSIVNRFGLSSLDILEKEPERLLEISGITNKKLEKIKESYAEHKSLQDIVAYLSPFGITVKKSVKILKQFGADVMDVLLYHPFRLCKISGFGFKIVDEIARKTSCAPNDPLRIAGGLQYILDEAENDGHLYLPLDLLCASAEALLNDGFPARVVQPEAVTEVLRVELKSSRCRLIKGSVYKLKNFLMESETGRIAAGMLAQKPDSLDITPLLADAQAELGVELSDKQREAVQMVFQSSLSILTGGPGTGKTTTLRTILWIYQKAHPDNKVLLAAPTGRASRRMADSTGFAASTLHSALGLLSDSDEDDNENDPPLLSAELIMVDEMSMVDMRLAWELFRRVQAGTKLLLVGDPDQLPSVGAGNVFRELISCGRIPVTVLDLIYRQSGVSRIVYNARAVNTGDTHLKYGPDFEFVPCQTPEQAAEIIRKRYLEEITANGIDNVQVLSPFSKKTEAGTKRLNELLQESVNPPSIRKLELKVGKRTFRVKDRVLQTKNRGEVSNGDIGIIQGIVPGSSGSDASVLVEFSGGRTVEYSRDELDIILLAYAITIHKSQGNECGTVILPLLNSFYVMLRRNLLYTAITRAKEKVILIGQQSAISQAIRRNDVDRRNTMLGKWICGYLDKAKSCAS